MSWGYGSPFPSSPFAQLAGLGQQFSPWIQPLMEMMRFRESSARQNLNDLLALPGLTPEQRQAAVGAYQKATEHLPAWMRAFGGVWPQAQVPVPGIGNPAVPSETFGVPRGLARTGTSPEERAPTATTPFVPAVPPQTRAEFVLPQQGLDDRPARDVIKADVFARIAAIYPDAQGQTYGQVKDLPGVRELLARQFAPTVEPIALSGTSLAQVVQQVRQAMAAGTMTQQEGTRVIEDYKNKMRDQLRAKALVWAQGGQVDPQELARQMADAQMNPQSEFADAQRQAATRQAQAPVTVSTPDGQTFTVSQDAALNYTKDAGNRFRVTLPNGTTVTLTGEQYATYLQRGARYAAEEAGRIPKNVEVAIGALQKQIDATPPGPARDVLVKRLQGIYDRYRIPATAGPGKGEPIPSLGTGSKAPSQNAFTAYTSWSTSRDPKTGGKIPIPKDVWDALTPTEQTWLINQGVTVER